MGTRVCLMARQTILYCAVRCTMLSSSCVQPPNFFHDYNFPQQPFQRFYHNTINDDILITSVCSNKKGKFSTTTNIILAVSIFLCKKFGSNIFLFFFFLREIRQKICPKFIQNFPNNYYSANI